jgi:hypothetical protein
MFNYHLVVSHSYLLVFMDNIVNVCGTESMWSSSFIKFGFSVFIALSVHINPTKYKMVSLEIKLKNCV